mmetsp:Transcript_57126/g.139235  ORF Transcript_57126/g.139235 Transcript_57126/m.139235 type:complete len:97 (-) Transcript_57126:1895-2185(-)
MNTFAVDVNDPSNVVTGELNFYVNGQLKWALELVRLGSKIGDHVARFEEMKGNTGRSSKMIFLLLTAAAQRRNRCNFDRRNAHCTSRTASQLANVR